MGEGSTKLPTQARSFKYAQIAQRAEQKTQRSRQIQPVCRVGHNLYLLPNSRPIQSAEEVHGTAKVRGLFFGRCTPIRRRKNADNGRLNARKRRFRPRIRRYV